MILRGRRQLGWTYRGSAYCQLIRQANKVKRLEWARAHLRTTSRTFCGRMKRPYSWSATNGFAVGRKASDPAEASCKASCEGACVGWNGMAWRQRNLYFQWNNGCSDVLMLLVSRSGVPSGTCLTLRLYFNGTELQTVFSLKWNALTMML